MASLSIEVICPECGSEHRVNTRLAGRRFRCPQCDAAVAVPSAPSAVSESSRPVESVETIGAAENAQPGQNREPAQEAEAAQRADSPPEDRDPSDQKPVVFASDPVFDTPGHHSATDLPDLPPSLQSEDDEELPVRNKRKEDELDMTPMVDVTFLLLIFFMVTASFSLQKSIEMPRQQTDAPSTNVQEEEEEDLDMVTVQIDEYGSFLVLAPDWERETPGKQNLTSALREAIGVGGGAVRLVIEVHEDAQLRYLVDCMDAGTISGYSEIQVTQVDGFL